MDPYHGKQKPLPEPEPMELPDDINLENNEMEEEDEVKNNFIEVIVNLGLIVVLKNILGW